MPQPPCTADILERLAGQPHSVAFDYREPSPSPRHSDERIAEVERICTEARAAVRAIADLDHTTGQ